MTKVLQSCRWYTVMWSVMSDQTIHVWLKTTCSTSNTWQTTGRMVGPPLKCEWFEQSEQVHSKGKSFFFGHPQWGQIRNLGNMAHKKIYLLEPTQDYKYFTRRGPWWSWSTTETLYLFHVPFTTPVSHYYYYWGLIPSSCSIAHSPIVHFNVVVPIIPFSALKICIMSLKLRETVLLV